MPPRYGPLTGFDVRKLASEAGQPANDPWVRHEAWRYSPAFSRWNRFKGALPGFGYATVAFTIYCGYEYLFLNDKKHH